MLYKIVYAIARFFFPRIKVIFKTPVETPAVFVCNHLGAFGPLAMMLYYNYPVRPWVNYRATQKRLAALEISENLFDRKTKVPLCIRKLTGNLLQYPALWVMRELKAIPVYYNAADVGDTLNESIRALKNGTSIVIFADRSQEEDHSGEDITSGIKTGFILMARLYERSTGKKLPFYPVHISRNKKEIRTGTPVFYDIKNAYRQEIKRVEQCLINDLQEMSDVQAE